MQVFAFFLFFRNIFILVIDLKIISHRGESTYAPENSLESFFLSYYLNSDGIETDVRKTKDNRLILFHDKSLKRLCSVDKNIDEVDYKYIKSMDISNNNYYKKTNIVLLEDFLDIFLNKSMEIFLELKEEDYELYVLDLLYKYRKDNLTIISFKKEVLKKIRFQDDNIKLGLLTYGLTNKDYDFCLDYNINNIICNKSFYSRNNITKCHDNSIKYSLWGNITKNDVEQYKKNNVDYLISNSYYDLNDK